MGSRIQVLLLMGLMRLYGLEGLAIWEFGAWGSRLREVWGLGF